MTLRWPIILLAIVVLGGVGTALSREPASTARRARAAVVVGPGVPPAALRRAVDRARGAGVGATVTVRRVGGPLDARAQAAALAAGGYGLVVGAGPDARAAIAEARAAELGGTTRWAVVP